eukprot:TRINITY_DN2785_c0_g1_i3.p2 TRINITY_DN2785_c0_g1~~TRINITY_DN2785_c0_g1_i3.p2  ORF type:complete len:161 (+),score=26.07 TRINITY_DN2785_c0_g1_i3:50-484(+)
MALKCELCQASFNVVVRRHHCRRCGLVFCNNCSLKRDRLVLHGYPSEQVRVCNNCAYLAPRENAVAEVHLPKLLEGTAFQRPTKLSQAQPVFFRLNTGKTKFEWWSAQLQQNRASNIINSFPVENVLNISSGLSKTRCFFYLPH